MPGGDRTGPRGYGPMTGRGAGYCAGHTAPGYANAAFGRGRGFGGGGRNEAEEKAGAGKVVRVKDTAEDREVTRPARAESACARRAERPLLTSVEFHACGKHAPDAVPR